MTFSAFHGTVCHVTTDSFSRVNHSKDGYTNFLDVTILEGENGELLLV